MTGHDGKDEGLGRDHILISCRKVNMYSRCGNPYSTPSGIQKYINRKFQLFYSWAYAQITLHCPAKILPHPQLLLLLKISRTQEDPRYIITDEEITKMWYIFFNWIFISFTFPMLSQNSPTHSPTHSRTHPLPLLCPGIPLYCAYKVCTTNGPLFPLMADQAIF